MPPLSSQSNHTLDLVRLTPLCTVHRPLARVQNIPEPKPDYRYRLVRIIPKHLQTVSVLLIRLPTYLFS